jgi:hypothetical protein
VALVLLLPCTKKHLFVANDGEAVIESIANVPKVLTFEKRTKSRVSGVLDTYELGRLQRLGVSQQLLVEERTECIERPALRVKHQVDPKSAGISLLLFECRIPDWFVRGSMQRDIVSSLATAFVISTAMLEPFVIPTRIVWNLGVGECENELLIGLTIVLSKRAQGKWE